jgi:hypothetical protein
VPDLANHATLVAPSDRAGDVAGMVAAAVSTKPAASSRWWSRASVGVGLGLAGVAAVVASWAGHADRSFASPPVVDPSPIAAPAPPAAVPPAAPAGAPAALGLEVARPSAARPPVQPAVLRQAAGARGGRSHKPAPHSRSHRKKGAGESDLDSPLNPYAR